MTEDLRKVISTALRRAAHQGADLTNTWIAADTVLAALAPHIDIDAEFVESGWSCHPSPDRRRWFKFHDRNSVHMDGCVPLYVRRSDADARLSGES